MASAKRGMDDPEPRKVPKQSYATLLNSLKQTLKPIETQFQTYKDTATGVTSHDEKTMLTSHLQKARLILDKWEHYLEQHGLHEAKCQESHPDHKDADLEIQTKTFNTYDDKVNTYRIKLNQHCKEFNKENPPPPRSAKQAQNNVSPNRIIVFKDDDKIRMTENIRPPPLQENSGVLKVANWEKAIKAYFEINAMDHKSREVQKATFFHCLDDKLQKFLTVKYATMPDVDIVSDSPDSFLKAIVAYFEQKNPLPIRISDFFLETQKSAESPNDWVQRVESMALAGKIENLGFEDLLKYKIITGLTHDDTLRARLLKNCHEPVDKIKEMISSHEATVRVANAMDKKLHISTGANHVSSYKRQQTENRQNQYQNLDRLPMARTLRGAPFTPRPQPPLRQPSTMGPSFPRTNPPYSCNKSKRDGTRQKRHTLSSRGKCHSRRQKGK